MIIELLTSFIYSEMAQLRAQFTSSPAPSLIFGLVIIPGSASLLRYSIFSCHLPMSVSVILARAQPLDDPIVLFAKANIDNRRRHAP